jgi:hypothetical protein
MDILCTFVKRCWSEAATGKMSVLLAAWMTIAVDISFQDRSVRAMESSFSGHSHLEFSSRFERFKPLLDNEIRKDDPDAASAVFISGVGIRTAPKALLRAKKTTIQLEDSGEMCC